MNRGGSEAISRPGYRGDSRRLLYDRFRSRCIPKRALSLEDNDVVVVVRNCHAAGRAHIIIGISRQWRSLATAELLLETGLSLSKTPVAFGREPVLLPLWTTSKFPAVYWAERFLACLLSVGHFFPLPTVKNERPRSRNEWECVASSRSYFISRFDGRVRKSSRLMMNFDDYKRKSSESSRCSFAPP